jgi:hypothetical protein
MQHLDREDQSFRAAVSRVVRAVLTYDVSSQVCTRIWRLFSTVLLSLITALLLNIGGRIAETVVLVREMPGKLDALNQHMENEDKLQKALEVRIGVAEELSKRYDRLIDRLMDTTGDILRIESGAHPGAYRDVPKLNAPASEKPPP